MVEKLQECIVYHGCLEKSTSIKLHFFCASDTLSC